MFLKLFLVLVLILKNEVCSDIILDTEDDVEFLEGDWQNSGFGYVDNYTEFEDGSSSLCSQLEPIDIGGSDEQINTGYWVTCGYSYIKVFFGEFGVTADIPLPTSIYIRGFRFGADSPLQITLYSNFNIYVSYYVDGTSWFEIRFPYTKPELAYNVILSVDTTSFLLLDKIVFGMEVSDVNSTSENPSTTTEMISTTESSITTCGNNPEYLCDSIDKFDQEWRGCFGETVFKKCNASSNNYASWFCSYNGKFSTDNPDYSQCYSQWLEHIQDGIEEVEIVSKEIALQWIELMDNKTVIETSAPLYYGHEIKKIFMVGEELFRKLDTNISITTLEELTTRILEVYHKIIVNPIPWADIKNETYLASASATGTSFIKAIQTSALKLNDQIDGEEYFTLAEFAELRVATLRIIKNSSKPIMYPSYPSESEAFIEIPASWADYFPSEETVGFMGIHVSNEEAKRLFPVYQENVNENFRILGEKVTFTFQGKQEVQFSGEGAKVHFKHQNPLEIIRQNEMKKRRFPFPEPLNFKQAIKKCVYWNFKNNSWSGQGCKLFDDKETDTICECQHLSSFAVLFDVHNIVSDEMPLEIISWILSIISIACLLLTVYVFSQDYIKTDRSPRRSITRHLAFSLLVAHIGLLLSIDTNNISPSKEMCTVLGVITHYAFLCAFAWMGWEGIVLYKAIFIVFEKREPKWIQYTTAYGIPALILLITGIIGFTKKESPYHSLTETDCWLTESYIWAFIGPATIIISANLILLILSVRKAYNITHSPKLNVNRQNKQSFGTMVTGSFSLSIILGLTWIFGYLVMIDDRSVALASAYIFTILNSSQGIFIFVFHVLTNKTIKKRLDRQLDRLNAGTSSRGLVSQNSTKQTY